MILIIVSLIYSVSSALTPFFIGITVSYIALPLILIINEFYSSKKGSITLGVVLTYLVLAILILIIAPFLYHRIIDIVQSISAVKIDLDNLKFADEAEQVIDNIRSQIISKIPGYLASISSAIITSTQSLISLIFSIIFAPMISIYFLQDIHYAQKKHWIISYLSNLSENFIRTQMYMIAFYTTFYFVLLVSLSIKNSVTLSFICGVLYIVPYVGPITGCITSVMLAFIEYGFDFHVIALIVGFLTINIVDTLFISPKLIGPKFGLHPLMTIFSLLISSYLFGIIGIILAIPLGVIMKDLLLLLIEFTHQKKTYRKANE